MPLQPCSLPNVPCVVLAGGKSRRFGADKSLATLNGHTLLNLMVARLREQTSGPIAVNSPRSSGKEARSSKIVPDIIGDQLGPLAGIHAAMIWAENNNFEYVATVPVDTPLLPDSFLEQLLNSGAPAVAKYNERLHPLHSLWPVKLASELEVSIKNGMRAAQAWAEACNAIHCRFDTEPHNDPFLNVNTPQDLIKAVKYFES